jgi:protein-disulfide isomerase
VTLIRLALAASALMLAACEAPREPEPYTTVSIAPFLGQPVLGKPDAPVELVEYASTTCGHCAAFHAQVLPQLKEKYIDTGKVRLAWVVMPTPPAPVSIAGAAIARCAGEARFFDVIDDLFAHQDEIVESARNPWRLQKQLRDVGARHGLSADQVGTCIDDKAIAALTLQGAKDAPAFITGTPTFLIGGEKVEAPDLEGLTAALDAALAKAPAAPVPAPQ